MKKTMLMLFGLMAMTLLVGCGTQNVNPDEEVLLEDENVVIDENVDETIMEDEDVVVDENVDEEGVDFVLPEGAKTSLTSEELDMLAEAHFPSSYSYTEYNYETQESVEGGFIYPKDLSHTLLIPSHATMASREVISSGIEDGMIYTLTKLTLQDGTEVEVLYIVDPETLNFVAATEDNGIISTNYQFSY